MNAYDYIICGAGPSGLTMAYCLGNLGKKCLVLDSNDSIGGCHRVTRVDGMFSEHGPRIYSSAYVNTIALLSKMNVKFSDLFTPYNYSISTIGGKTISNLHITELFWLGLEFFLLVFNPCHGKNISIGQYMIDKKFCETGRDYIDRLCRFTDGAGADRYSLFEFLSLANDQSMYKIYQPKLPNDVGLFKVWKDALDKTGNVTIQLGALVTSVDSTSVSFLLNNNPTTVHASKIILAVPPTSLVKILSSSSDLIKNAFGPLDKLSEWSVQTNYINDIPITFHWKTSLSVPQTWGYPKLEWGVVWVELSKYMDFQDPRSKTVFSVCVTKPDRISTTTGKTANNSNQDELINEVFRQLHDSFPGYDLPIADMSILNPGVSKINSQWIDSSTAYMASSGTSILNPASETIPTIFNLGTQNGNSEYSFTSFESAVSNALSLLHHIENGSNKIYPLIKLVKLTDIIRVIFFICISLIVIYLIIHI